MQFVVFLKNILPDFSQIIPGLRNCLLQGNFFFGRGYLIPSLPSLPLAEGCFSIMVYIKEMNLFLVLYLCLEN